MKAVGAYEAKTRLPELLREVEHGERVTITKHGVPVAMLVPIDVEKQDAGDAIRAWREYRQQHKITLGGASIRELVEEGRR